MTQRVTTSIRTRVFRADVLIALSLGLEIEMQDVETLDISTADVRIYT